MKKPTIRSSQVWNLSQISVHMLQITPLVTLRQSRDIREGIRRIFITSGL